MNHEMGEPKPGARSSSPGFNRRDMLRAAFYATVASALGPTFSFAQAVHSEVTAAARGEDGSAFLANPNWKATFLTDEQNNTLVALSEVIIPATDTPGAKDALVNRYLDLLLSVQPAEFQRKFVDALAFIDAESRKHFGQGFGTMSVDDQVSLLTPWAYGLRASQWTEREEGQATEPESGQEHFDRLKALVAMAYYGSEIGRQELGWDASVMNGPYQGCEHSTADHT